MNWFKDLFMIIFHMIKNKVNNYKQSKKYDPRNYVEPKRTIMDKLIEIDELNTAHGFQYNTIRMDSDSHLNLLREVNFVRRYGGSYSTLTLYSGQFKVILDNEVQGFEFTQERGW